MEHNFTFTPVSCHKGRKWKGDLAYYLGHDPQENAYRSLSIQLFDPIAKRYVYANPKFTVEIKDVANEKVEADKQEYLTWVFESCERYCGSRQTPGTEEFNKYVRNCLMKWHPELETLINEKYPLDISKEIHDTLDWAMSLVTQPGSMYGRHYNGGKPLKDEKKITIAYSNLHRKKLTLIEGFDEIWELEMALRGIMDVAKPVVDRLKLSFQTQPDLI